jgi:hypothetical protein
LPDYTDNEKLAQAGELISLSVTSRAKLACTDSKAIKAENQTLRFILGTKPAS